MPCKACPGSLMDVCGREGCALTLEADRTATTVAPQDDFAPSLRLLDLQEGDIVTVTTPAILDDAKARRWQDGLERLIRAQGWRHVSVLILDAGTAVAVDRPAWPDTRMAHQSRVEPQAMQGC